LKNNEDSPDGLKQLCRTVVADGRIVKCQKHLLVFDVAGKTLRWFPNRCASKANRVTKCFRIVIPGCGKNLKRGHDLSRAPKRFASKAKSLQ
jgi:hypothetical protein